MQTKTFRGGVHPKPHKLSAEAALQELVAPQTVIIPLKQHIGTTVRPLVEVGDRVYLGQKIGDSDEGLCAPVHASVSGTVRTIDVVDTADGHKTLAIIVDNDGLDTLAATVYPCLEWESTDRSELRHLIREGGIVGMGGVGYPTHAKLSPPENKRFAALIVNAVECDPYLTCDYRLLLEQPELIFIGIRVLMRAAAIDRAYIAVTIAQRGVPEALRPHFEHETGIDLVFLESKYPQGEERQLIYAVTGREIPSGGMSEDVGTVVVNVATAWAVGVLVTTGMPSVRRVVTIAGAVKSPGNFMVRVGTTLEHVLQVVGGAVGSSQSVVLGSPMTGLPQLSLSVPISKPHGGLLVLNHKQLGTSAQTNCIHCGRCVEACPCRLMPLYLAKESEREELGRLGRYHILDCCECASCAYVCPAKIPLLHWIRRGKGLALVARQQAKECVE